MPSNNQCLSINLEKNQAEAFRDKLKELGFQRGKNVDLSGFGTAIADNELLVFRKENKITEILQQLIDEGRYDLALKIGQTAKVEGIYPKFLDRIYKQIQDKKPFRLEYLDIAGKPFVFDCSYAQISLYEGRQYLEVRFVNEVDSDSIEGLRKNRCLRIDRIPETSQISSLSGVKWSCLEQIDISFLVRGNLAFAYKNNPENSTEIISKPGEETRVKIHTKISNDFWFIRKILGYGSSAEILSPDSLRNKLKEEVEKTIVQYH